MTPASFAPCAAFARETLSIPPVPYACERRPPTKAALAAAEREWKRRWTQAGHQTVSVNGYRLYVHMERASHPTEGGVVGRPVFTAGIAFGFGGFTVDVPAFPVDDLPARLHAAALGLLARYANTLTERAAALTTEAAAVRALIPTPPARAPRPTCPLCETDAAAPTVERLILVPHTVHAACVAACGDDYPEPGVAIDRVADFVEEHMPDCDARSLRYAAARADLAERYPGILTIAAALKAAP